MKAMFNVMFGSLIFICPMANAEVLLRLNCELFIPEVSAETSEKVALSVEISGEPNQLMANTVSKDDNSSLVSQLKVKETKHPLSSLSAEDRAVLVRFVEIANLNASEVHAIVQYSGGKASDGFYLIDLFDINQRSIGAVGTITTEIGGLPFKCQPH